MSTYMSNLVNDGADREQLEKSWAEEGTPSDGVGKTLVAYTPIEMLAQDNIALFAEGGFVLAADRQPPAGYIGYPQA